MLPDLRRPSVHFAIAATLFAAPVLADSTIVPEAPVAFESVHLRLSVDDCMFNPTTVSVSLDRDRIAVTHQPNLCVLPGAPRTVDIRLGELPVGRYRVDLHASTDPTQEPVESISFDVLPRPEVAVFPPPPRPLADYSGVWWDPAQPGFGLTLHQSPYDAMFGAVFAFDLIGSPVWRTLQNGRWIDTTTWEGTLYRTTPSTNAVTEPIGMVTLSFTDLPATGQARMTTVVDSVVTETTLVRPRW